MIQFAGAQSKFNILHEADLNHSVDVTAGIRRTLQKLCNRSFKDYDLEKTLLKHDQITPKDLKQRDSQRVQFGCSSLRDKRYPNP